jgi:predicted dehydrogenase
MKPVLPRRHFLKQTSVAAGFAALGGFNLLRAQESPAKKLVVGIMGCNNRGMDHIAGYLAVPNVEIGYICDVDRRAVEKGIAAVAKKQARAPKGTDDFRRMLEDKSVDAISIAAPDFWHTPATVLACAAGKHVYVEKPGSHNAHESELIVAAARKHKRVVQMGNQRRSWPWVIEAISALHAGEIGKTFFARAWYTNHRPTIGRGKPTPVPEWLNYDLWQGPTPERPFRDNLLHYNWHWFWHYSTSELGNNGVHSLDLARWGLCVDLPQRVTCGGNRYHFQDDWETPDVCVATFDFGTCAIVWEGQSCDPRGFEGAGFGVNFYGEKGAMTIAGDNCKIFDLGNKLVREIKGKGDGGEHFANFAEAIREGKKLNSEIEEGQKATLYCHLGNIAWRTGHTVDFDPAKRVIKDDRKATALWRREYRKGWEPKV